MNVVAVPANSCKMSYTWDWGTTYSNPYELYRLMRIFIPESEEDAGNYDKEIIYTKNRLRGRGVAPSIKLTSEAGTTCTVAGLALMFTG